MFGNVHKFVLKNITNEISIKFFFVFKKILTKADLLISMVYCIYLSCVFQVDKSTDQKIDEQMWYVFLTGCIGVNATGVAGVATPPLFYLPGSSCVDDPQYFDKCFIFFPSAEILNTASRCYFHLQCAQCTVFNSPVEHES